MATGGGAEDLRRAMDLESTQEIQASVLSKILEDMSSADPAAQSVSLLAAHRIIFNFDCPHACAAVDVLIGSGILPKCLNLLKSETNPGTLNAVVCILLSISSRDFDKNRAVVNSGAVEPLIGLLSSPHANLAEKALWALTNIVVYGSHFRHVIDKGFILPLVAVVESRTEPRILDHASRAFMYIFRVEDPGLSPLLARQCLPALARLISHEDEKIVSNVLASLFHVSRTQEGIQEIVNLSLVPKLVTLIGSKVPKPYVLIWSPGAAPKDSTKIILDGLWTLAHILSGNTSQSQVQVIIDAGVLNYLPTILRRSPHEIIVQGVALIIAHTVTGTAAQRQAILDTGIIEGLLGILRIPFTNVSIESCLAIRNIACHGNIEQLTSLYYGGVIPVLCGLLGRVSDTEIALILEATEGILKGFYEAGRAESVVKDIERYDGYDKIEQLLVHENQTINSRAYNLLDTYFDRNLAAARTSEPGQEMDTSELYHMTINIQPEI